MNNNSSSSERNCTSTVTNPHRNQTRFWVMGYFNLLHVSRCAGVRPFRPIDWFRKEVWPIACKLATRDQIYRAEPRGGKQNCRLEVYGKMCILVVYRCPLVIDFGIHVITFHQKCSHACELLLLYIAFIFAKVNYQSTVLWLVFMCLDAYFNGQRSDLKLCILYK